MNLSNAELRVIIAALNDFRNNILSLDPEYRTTLYADFGVLLECSASALDKVTNLLALRKIITIQNSLDHETKETN